MTRTSSCAPVHKKRPRAVFVITGTELVRGERTDLNGPFLAREALRLGFEPARPHKRAAPKPKQAHLVLTPVRGDCWLEVHVRTADGKLGFVGTLEQGAKPLSLTAKRLWIRAGAPQNLDVELNGKPRSFPYGPVTVIVTPGRIARASTAA